MAAMPVLFSHSSLSASECTTYNGITYSGKIYTISGSQYMSESTYRQFMPVDGADPEEYEEHKGTDIYNGDSFWGYLWYMRPERTYYTLRLSDYTTWVQFNIMWKDACIGGIITEAGNDEQYVLFGDATYVSQVNRNIHFESSTGAVEITLRSNLYLDYKTFNAGISHVYFESDSNWRIASGKEFTIASYHVQVDAGKNITISRLDSVKTVGDVAAKATVRREMTMGEGGVLTVEKGIIFTVGGTFTAGDVRVHGGTLVIGSDPSAVMGAIADSTSIVLDEGGSLIYNPNKMTADCGGRVELYDSSTFDLAGVVSRTAVVMHGGSLANAEKHTGSITIDVTKPFGRDFIDLGGADAGNIKSINMTVSGVHLNGLKEGSKLTLAGKENTLSVGVGNTDLNGAKAQALIEFTGGDGHVSFASDGSVTILLDLDAKVLAALRRQDTFTLSLTNGEILGAPTSEKQLKQWVEERFAFREALVHLGFAVEGLEGGALLISGSTKDAYLVSEDGNEVNHEFELGRYRTVMVDEDLTLNFDIGKDAEENSVLNQVDGFGTDSSLNINKRGVGDITIELHNDEGRNTTLGGALTEKRLGTGRADLKKSGKGSLTIGGNLSVADDLWVAEGGMTLNGKTNSVGGALCVGDAESNETGQLVVNGLLSVGGDADLRQGKGSISGGGGLHITPSGSLTLSGSVEFKLPSLILDGELDLNTQSMELNSLSGTGAVKGEGDILVKEHFDFTGAMEGKGSLILAGKADIEGMTASGYVLRAASGSDMSLSGATFRGIELQKGAQVELRAPGSTAAAAAGANVRSLGDVIFRNGSTTTLCVNMDSKELWGGGGALMLSADGEICIEKGAAFKLKALQDDLADGHEGDLSNVVVMRGKEVRLVDSAEQTLSVASLSRSADELAVDMGGLFYIYYKEASLTVQGNEVLLNAVWRTNDEVGDGTENTEPGDDTEPGGDIKPGGDTEPESPVGFLEESITGSSSSGAALAGAVLLDHVNMMQDDTLASLGDALGDMLAEGHTAQAAKVMAEVAGGAVTALGSAQRDALRERMNRARAHAEQGYYVPQDKKLHTWIEAAASYAKVGADGDESGYKLDSWGGSVGADYAVSGSLTVGLSLTAMYGDLTAEAAEQATGKLDAYYFSLWAHKQSSRWGHTFLVTVSTSDATLDRTVDYGTGAYTAQGSTSGSGYGALYELTYDMPISETSFWQPLASISMMSTSMDAYEETGAEGAGLAVGEQEQTVTTVAIGARWVSRAGANLFGSTAVVELSGRIAQDMGDTRSEADNALLANPSYTRKVQGAEVGSTALQLGAGLSIPTGKATQVYMNANADLRSGATSWTIGAGVRLSF